MVNSLLVPWYFSFPSSPASLYFSDPQLSAACILSRFIGGFIGEPQLSAASILSRFYRSCIQWEKQDGMCFYSLLTSTYLDIFLVSFVYLLVVLHFTPSEKFIFNQISTFTRSFMLFCVFNVQVLASTGQSKKQVVYFDS